MYKFSDENDTSFLGRYLGMKALHGQSQVRHPWWSALGGAGKGFVTGVGSGLGGPPGRMIGSALGSPFLGMASVGTDEEKAKKDLMRSIEAARARKGDFGASFGYGVRRNVGPIALLSALGALGGGIAGTQMNLGRQNPLLGALLGAGAGGLGAAGLGVLGTGGPSAINEAILARLSPETAKRTTKLVGENPGLTSLPFSHLIGAGMTGGKREEGGKYEGEGYDEEEDRFGMPVLHRRQDQGL
jgi:hypothetical protein